MHLWHAHTLRGPRKMLAFYSVALCFILLTQSLLLILEWAWYLTNPSNCPVPGPNNTGVTGNRYTQLFTQVLRFELRSSCMYSKCFYPLSHLPRLSLWESGGEGIRCGWWGFYPLLSCGYDKRPWPRWLITGIVYLDKSDHDKERSQQAGMVAGAGSWDLTFKIASMKQREPTESGSRLNLKGCHCCWGFFPARSHCFIPK